MSTVATRVVIINYPGSRGFYPLPNTISQTRDPLWDEGGGVPIPWQQLTRECIVASLASFFAPYVTDCIALIFIEALG